MKSALIDTNLFVLMVIGTVDKDYISSHKRSNCFTTEDYELLMDNLRSFQELWITSHCLAEVSNLLKQTNSKKQEELLNGLKTICQITKESHSSHSRIVHDAHYLKLGIADTGIIQKSKRVSCTFTVDLDLYLSMIQLGRNVVNFTHLRNHLYQ